jgi:hypothetical protein
MIFGFTVKFFIESLTRFVVNTFSFQPPWSPSSPNCLAGSGGEAAEQRIDGGEFSPTHFTYHWFYQWG